MKFLESKSVKELIALAKEWGLTGYSKMKKSELIALLIKSREQGQVGSPTADTKEAPMGAGKDSKGSVAPTPAAKSNSASRTAGPTPPLDAGTSRIGLLARDPHWLYCFWELSENVVQRIQAGQSIALQVFCIVEGREEFIERIHLSPDARSWYLHVAGADMAYRCDLGLVDEAERFRTLLASNVSTTPPEGVSPQVEAVFGPGGEALGESFYLQQAQADRMYALSAGLRVRGLDSAEAQWLREQLERQGQMPAEALYSASLPILSRSLRGA